MKGRAMSNGNNVYKCCKSKQMIFNAVMMIQLFLTATLVFAEVQTYPAPEGEAITDVYSVTVDGEPVDVYAAQSQHFEGDYYFASFDFSGKVAINVTSKFPMEKTQILPKHFALDVKCSNNAVDFVTDQPFRASVEPNGRVKPLLLFGNAIENDAPDPNAPNVVYFGPGVHRPGKITLCDHQTLYLAQGAVVKGAVLATGENITVCGRGILAGEDSPRFSGPGRFMLDLTECKNVTVRDITIRNPWSWTAVTWNCDGVVFDNVKICGSRMINDDALDLVNTQNVVVRNCFFRTQDDSIAVKGAAKMTRPCENIKIENCQFWTDVANIFRIGYECETEGMRGIDARNIDILHYSKNYRAPTDYWANTIIWLQPSNNMTLENCHFENFTIYSDGSAMILLMAKPMRCTYGDIKKPEPGRIKNCVLKNIEVVGIPGDFGGVLYFLGADAKHSVNGVTLENIRYFGEPIRQNSPCVEIGPNVEYVEFH